MEEALESQREDTSYMFVQTTYVMAGLKYQLKVV